jgi:transaldolase/glucose-6-phosphate isomerase
MSGATGGDSLPTQVESLPEAMRRRVDAELQIWRDQGKSNRLWEGDAGLWTGGHEGQWLGWLRAVEEARPQTARLESIVQQALAEGFRQVLLLGMGGSSLCPEVLARSMGTAPGFVELIVLDSVVPAQVQATRERLDLAKTLVIVASKSGSTIEPNMLGSVFLHAIEQEIPASTSAYSRYIAITDPNSPLHVLARSRGFRHIVQGEPTIGGRYSALSNFGLLPAAFLGVPLGPYLDRAAAMAASCGPEIEPRENPGVRLGLTLGVLAREFGRDKLTLLASPGIRSFGSWVEQLIAESTGKHDPKTGIARGLVPVDDEPGGSPADYGADRVFVVIEGPGELIATQPSVKELEAAGHPIIRIRLNDHLDLAAEFFRWEIATAAAGATLGINPFDQPDVEASKVRTRELMSAFSASGKMPEPQVVGELGELRVFTDSANQQALRVLAVGDASVIELLAAHLARIQPGDYFALLAYLDRNDANRVILDRIRARVRDRFQVATTLGFGPRFLHSTGQLHKGGPNTGVFLQITADDRADLAIPDEKYSLGQLARFQALGDFEILCDRGRRAVRVHLGPEVTAGLAELERAIDASLRA